MTPKKPPSIKPMTPRNMNTEVEVAEEPASPPPPKVTKVTAKVQPKPMPKTALDDLGDMPIEEDEVMEVPEEEQETEVKENMDISDINFDDGFGEETAKATMNGLASQSMEDDKAE